MAVTLTKGTTYAASASVTSATITLPTGLVAGDLTFLFCTLNASSGVITPPSGWTEALTSTNSSTSTSSSHVVAIYYNDWTSGDPNPVVTCSSGRLAVIPVKVSGANTTNPLEGTVQYKTQTSATTAIDAPAITATNSRLLVTVHSGRSATTGTTITFTPPTGMTEVGDVSATSSSLNNAAIEVNSLVLTTAGSVAAKTATASTSLTGSSGMSLLLAPAAATAVTGSAAVSLPRQTTSGAVTVVTPGPATSTLTDDFTTQDGTKWIGWGTDASVVSGQLSLNAVAAYPAIQTATTYNFTGSSVYAQLATRPNLSNGSTETFLQAQSDFNNGVHFGWGNGSWVMRDLVGGVTTADYLADDGTYNWVRMRSVGRTVYWDGSPDGTAWTNLRTRVVPIDLYAATVRLTAGTWNAATTPGAAVWDNVNTTPITTVTGAGAATLTGLTTTGAAAVSLTGTGSPSLQPPTATGAATVAVTGSGALTAARPTATGAGSLSLTGAGTPQAQRATVAAASAIILTGAAALTVPSPTVTGTGGPYVAGSAAIDLGAGRLTSTGTANVFTPVYTGAGAVTLPGFTASGAATLTVTGAGAAQVQRPTSTGAGGSAVTGAGAAQIPYPTTASNTTVTLTGSGADTLPRLTVAAAGVITSANVGAGSITLPGFTIAGFTGTLAMTGAGAAQSQRPTSTGAGTVTMTGSGAATLGRPTAQITGLVGALGGIGSVTLPRPTSIGAGSLGLTGAGAAALLRPVVVGVGRMPTNVLRGLIISGVEVPGRVRGVIVGGVEKAAHVRSMIVAGVEIPLGTPPPAEFTTLAVPRPTLAAAGAVRLTGAGAATLQPFTLAAATTVALTGSGAVSVPRQTVTAAASVTAAATVTGAGSPALQRQTTAGAGTLLLTGAGTVQVPRQAVTSAGALLLTGAGSPSAQRPTSTGAGTVGAQQASTTSKTYTASSAIIPNPGRGFFQYTETHYRTDGTGHTPLDSATLSATRTGANGRALVFRYFVMEKFLTQDTIDQAYLNLVAADLAAVRAAGCKAIIRFTYSTSGNMTPPYLADPPVARVIGHIQQLAGAVNPYADVVEALQHGFIGMWGENYYTDNFGDQGVLTAQNWTDRQGVLAGLLNYFDPQIYVLVRYPGIKARAFP